MVAASPGGFIVVSRKMATLPGANRKLGFQRDGQELRNALFPGSIPWRKCPQNAFLGSGWVNTLRNAVHHHWADFSQRKSKPKQSPRESNPRPFSRLAGEIWILSD